MKYLKAALYNFMTGMNYLVLDVLLPLWIFIGLIILFSLWAGLL